VAGHRPRRLSKGRKVLLTRAATPTTRRPPAGVPADGYDATVGYRRFAQRLPLGGVGKTRLAQDRLAAVARNGRVVGGMTAGAGRSGDATFALTAS
jgi:predicted MarR family transcription regulator